MSSQLGLLNVDLKSNDGIRRDSIHRPQRKRLIFLAIPLAPLAFIAAWLLFGGSNTISPYADSSATGSEDVDNQIRSRSDALLMSDNLYSQTSSPERIKPNIAPSGAAPHSEPVAPPTTYVSQSATVTGGDSLLGMFERLGLNVSQWYSMRDAHPDIKRLTKIKPGDTLHVERTEGGDLVRLAYQYDREHSLEVTRDNQGYRASTKYNPIERDIVSASGTISGSFYMSAQRAGLEDKQIMELAELFAWDINFALDIWEGDRFSVLYEKLSQDGKFIGYGDIVAAEFHNRQRQIQTVRYTDDEGKHHYFTPEGRSMRRAFLQSPVHFTRISSGFSLARLHPIHKTKRPHRGVDYAAPKGTKIMASGDGVVEFIGRQNGFGKTVILRHGKRYTTLYAHMSKFAKLKKGARVKQGQTIGYVGMTGAATGDHLHYEFRVDGVHKNPLTVKLPPAAPVNDSIRDDFVAQTEPLLGWLESISDKAPAIAGGRDDSVAAPAR